MLPPSSLPGPQGKLPPLCKRPSGGLGAPLPKPSKLAMLDSPIRSVPISHVRAANVDAAGAAESTAVESTTVEVLGSDPELRPPLRELHSIQLPPPAVARSNLPLATKAPPQQSLYNPPAPTSSTTSAVGEAHTTGHTTTNTTGSALKSEGAMASEQRIKRASWAPMLVRDEVSYEPSGDLPPLEYKANLSAMHDLRRQRRSAGQAELTFRELVAELDMAEGGEALSCLGTARHEPPPTWGQMLAQGEAQRAGS